MYRQKAVKIFMTRYTSKHKNFHIQKLFALALSLLIAFNSTSQSTQTIRGIVKDGILQKPLQGATIKLVAERKEVLTDSNGYFRFTGISVGSLQLTVSHIGYNNLLLDNVIVNAGKETVLELSLETDTRLEQEVVITAASKKNKPLNEFSTVSVRAFTVAETQRYAASINDPLRMATAFPGVSNTDDGTNNIVTRGNAPNGLLWRLKGVDIPNPNHFAKIASSGGGISILSSQLLANSDFITGAFAAEYGNALSGVFD